MTRKYKLIVAVAVLAFCSIVSVHEYNRARGAHDGIPLSSPVPASDRGPCVDFRQAPSHAGETGCVSGLILRAFTSKAGNTFLDFCSDYKNCPFSSVIFASDRDKFGNLEALAGRQVEIHGLISTYNGRAEIIIRDPQQIQAAP
jgi:hypothetical protein